MIPQHPLSAKAWSIGLLVLFAACNEPEPNPKPRDYPESRPDESRPDESRPPDDSQGGPDSVPDPPDDSGLPPDDTSTPAPDASVRYFGADRVVVITATSAQIVDPTTGVASPISGATDLGTQPVVSCSGDSIWILDSKTDGSDDRALRVDPTTGTVTAVWTLGAYVRPTDLIVVGDYFWITTYGKPRIYVANADGPTGGYIDLDAWADADGNPEAMGGRNLGDQTALVLGRVGQSDGSRNGARLVVLNNNNYASEQEVELVGNTPTGQILANDDTIWLEVKSTISGATAATDGGIERVSRTWWTTDGLFVQDATDGRTTTVASFDQLGSVVWRGYAPSTGGEWVGVWNLTDGNAMQSYSLAARPVGLGTIGGNTLWVGENGFDNISGALVSRRSTDGVEQARLTLDGPILGMRVCAREGP